MQKNKEWEYNDTFVYCRGNIETSGHIRYMPWYMVMFYSVDIERKVPKKYTVDFSGRSLQRN